MSVICFDIRSSKKCRASKRKDINFARECVRLFVSYMVRLSAIIRQQKTRTFFIISPKSSFNFIIVSYTLWFVYGLFFLISSSWPAFLRAATHPIDASWAFRAHHDVVAGIRQSVDGGASSSSFSFSSSIVVFNAHLLILCHFAFHFMDDRKIVCDLSFRFEYGWNVRLCVCVRAITCD